MTVVLVRSYSRGSRTSTCESEIGTPSTRSAAPIARSWRGVAYAWSNATAIASGRRAHGGALEARSSRVVNETEIPAVELDALPHRNPIGTRDEHAGRRGSRV